MLRVWCGLAATGAALAGAGWVVCLAVASLRSQGFFADDPVPVVALEPGDPSLDPRGKLTMPRRQAGVRLPRAAAAKDAILRDTDRVIGVSIGGVHRAYSVGLLSDIDTHVVNDVLGLAPVTVTYCNRTDCTRVFTGQEGAGPLDVWLAGWMGETATGTMAIALSEQGEALEHQSDQIPLRSLTFERATWGAWKAAHPDSDVVDRRAMSPGVIAD